MKILRQSGLLLLALFAFSCAKKDYYVFKKVKHTPIEKQEIATSPSEVAELALAPQASLGTMEEGTITLPSEEVSINKFEALVSDKDSKAGKAYDKIETSVNKLQTKLEKGEKISKLDQVQAALVVKKNAKVLAKEMKKAGISAEEMQSGKPKSQIVALILAILIGALGIHRFYLGYTTIGIIQLLTLGGCGVWALIDAIRIAIGDLLPADGSAYDPSL